MRTPRLELRLAHRHTRVCKQAGHGVRDPCRSRCPGRVERTPRSRGRSTPIAGSVFPSCPPRSDLRSDRCAIVGSTPARGRRIPSVNILSYNAGHDGAVAHVRDGHLISSVEAEKDSNWRFTPLGTQDLFDSFGRVDEVPDVVCTGGWWPREAQVTGTPWHVGYRGLTGDDMAVGHRRVFGKAVPFFSSSHERSHLLCAFGMSPFPQGSTCYALVWEGAIGAFYEIGSDMNITLIEDVMHEPGNRSSSAFRRNGSASSLQVVRLPEALPFPMKSTSLVPECSRTNKGSRTRSPLRRRAALARQSHLRSGSRSPSSSMQPSDGVGGNRCSTGCPNRGLSPRLTSKRSLWSASPATSLHVACSSPAMYEESKRRLLRSLSRRRGITRVMLLLALVVVVSAVGAQFSENRLLAGAQEAPTASAVPVALYLGLRRS